MNQSMATITIVEYYGEINAEFGVITFAKMPFFCCQYGSGIHAVIPSVFIENYIELLADIFLDFSTAVDFRMNYHQIIIEINRFIGILRDKIFCTAADKVSFDFHKGIVVNELNKLVR